MLGARVDEEQIAVPQPVGVAGVVQRARVRAAGHDGGIGRGAAPRPGELVEQLRLDLVLAHPRTADAHGALVGGGADPRRLRHHADLRLALEQTHLVDEVIEHDELAGAAAGAPAAADLRDPSEHALVELLEVSHRVVDPGRVFDQPRQDLVDVFDGKRIVGAVALAHPFQSEPGAVPLLRLGVTLPAEQHELALIAPGREDRHRLGFGEPGEIVEVAVGPERKLDVSIARLHRRRGHDGDAPLLHHLHQSPPAFREFSSIHGEWCSESDVAAHPARPPGTFRRSGTRRPCQGAPCAAGPSWCAVNAHDRRIHDEQATLSARWYHRGAARSRAMPPCRARSPPGSGAPGDSQHRRLHRSHARQARTGPSNHHDRAPGRQGRRWRSGCTTMPGTLAETAGCAVRAWRQLPPNARMPEETPWPGTPAVETGTTSRRDVADRSIGGNRLREGGGVDRRSSRSL